MSWLLRLFIKNFPIFISVWLSFVMLAMYITPQFNNHKVAWDIFQLSGKTGKWSNDSLQLAFNMNSNYFLFIIWRDISHDPTLYEYYMYPVNVCVTKEICCCKSKLVKLCGHLTSLSFLFLSASFFSAMACFRSCSFLLFSFSC